MWRLVLALVLPDSHCLVGSHSFDLASLSQIINGLILDTHWTTPEPVAILGDTFLIDMRKEVSILLNWFSPGADYREPHGA